VAANHSKDRGPKYQKAVVLRDGSTLRLRAIRPDDEDRLIAFVNRLSPQAVYLRFHHTLLHLTRDEAQRFCNVDYDNSFALVATTGAGRDERIIAVGRYYRLRQQDTAEAAFVVEDAYQGKGLGTRILKELAGIARGKGIRFFEADVLSDNAEMMQLFRDSGFHLTQEREGESYRVFLEITT
jgi:RimJ/RimL family protein N-acetyltransferase